MQEQTEHSDEISEIDAGIEALPADLKPAVLNRLTHTDNLLELLVALAENGIGFPITLNTGGVTVTGQIIGARSYYEAEADRMSQGQTRDMQSAVRGIFETQSQYVVTEGPRLPAMYIHLANARILTGNMLFPEPGKSPIFWRGKLVSVDGFSLGSFG